MILALIVAASCAWEAPGADRYTGNVPAAVDHYTDWPASVRESLKQRMERRQYDEVVTIRRDSIDGASRYASSIRDMHFGSKGKVCATVDRSMWEASAVERGLVYCEGDSCVLVPTVCGNVSRITRLPDPLPPPTYTQGPPVTFNAPPVQDMPSEYVPPAIVPPTTFTEGSGPPPWMPPPVWIEPPHWDSPPWMPPVFVTPPSLPPVVPTPVPEPGTWALMLLGLVGVATRRFLRSEA
jgi:hypothetical protein